MDDRTALLAHWNDLTRRVLPGMARAQGWPIRLDHCFMRVCLDQAVGDVWTAHIRRPAITHMDTATLARAVAIAESLRDQPDTLPALNHQSLVWRDKRQPGRFGGVLP